MPKEETIYLFRSNSSRLQLVCIYTQPEFTYQIRDNRIIKLRTHDKNMALARFKSLVFLKTQQLNLFEV